MKKYKIIKQKNDCVLLFDGEHGKYKVKDIENDDIYIGYTYETALKVFDDYDLEAIRQQRRQAFEKWLEEYAEA